VNAILSDKKSKNPSSDKITRAAAEPTVNYSRKTPVVRKTWAEKRLINEKIKAEQKELRRKEKEQKKARRKAEAKTIDKDIIANFIEILACVAIIGCIIASVILLFIPGRTAAIWCIITSVISLFLSIGIGMYWEVSWISIIGGIIFGFTLLVGTLQLFTVYGTTDMVVKNYILEKCFINQETVEVPDGVNEIASYAFGGRSYQRGEKIKSITLSDDVKYVRSFAFAGCDSLEEVYLGNNIRFIGARAFLGCNKLERIYFDGTEEEWNEILKGEDLGFILGFVDWDDGISNYEIIFLRQEQ
jgi:ABC-type multidrug transport system fused ATPase/permease subunit